MSSRRYHIYVKVLVFWAIIGKSSTNRLPNLSLIITPTSYPPNQPRMYVCARWSGGVQPETRKIPPSSKSKYLYVSVTTKHTYVPGHYRPPASIAQTSTCTELRDAPAAISCHRRVAAEKSCRRPHLTWPRHTREE